MKMEAGQSPAADQYAEGFKEGVRQALQRCRLLLASGNVTATACITALEAMSTTTAGIQATAYRCPKCKQDVAAPAIAEHWKACRVTG
ncbi:hypothetical protein [Cupriavidus gilardii]|uniref:Uncharacterized protein n=1 Tax=Cupriavidus gilardii TaxID=82541 RepID=A0A849BEC8_9BURK|nr:hypothetical protein [Cupriavidus gilardii]KAB0593767.1 hypothetical protein F7Q96_25015 [Cupriavidus gilardii]MCT9016936.1 hypothetical protein [Cupriavidus gilardii]MCT9056517.1 hypothetical protein [Cupriavidus gilardii]NNH13812.1 hypothetical protein [Cupriavidus gilardii]WNG69256.1 hypothetical protein QWJ31_19340 [Cupriavidus gilardii]